MIRGKKRAMRGRIALQKHFVRNALTAFSSNPRNPRWLRSKIRGTTIVTPTHSKPFDEKKFKHRRTGLNPQSCSDFIAAPSRARAALASLLAIVHCAGGGGRLRHGTRL